MRFLDAAFDDIDLMCESVRAWNLEFQPLSIAPGWPRVGHIVQSEIGGSLLAHARFHACLDQAGSAPPGLITFVVQEPGMRGLWWRGHDVDANSVLAFPLGGELRSLSGSDFDVHTLSVSEDMVGQAACALERGLPAPRERAEIFRVPQAVLDPVRSRLKALRDGLKVAHPDDIVRTVIALLPYWLFSQGDNARPRPAPRARQRAIRMSLELMESQDLTALRPATLRAHSGVSERTLEYAFQDRFGLTPAAFLKARRLAAVRGALGKSRPGGARVTDISTAFGFWHFGQFAKDYRRAFGERPSDTLRRSGIWQAKGE